MSDPQPVSGGPAPTPKPRAGQGPNDPKSIIRPPSKQRGADAVERLDKELAEFAKAFERISAGLSVIEKRLDFHDIRDGRSSSRRTKVANALPAIFFGCVGVAALFAAIIAWHNFQRHSATLASSIADFTQQKETFTGVTATLADISMTAKSLDETHATLKSTAKEFRVELERLSDARNELNNATKVLESGIKNAVDTNLPEIAKSIEAYARKKVDDVSTLQKEITELYATIARLRPLRPTTTRIILGDTSARNIMFLLPSLRTLQHEIEARRTTSPEYDVSFFRPRSADLFEFKATEHYLQPSEDATIDWPHLDISPLFKSEKDVPIRCILFCDGLDKPPAASSWGRATRVDVIVAPPGDFPPEKRTVEEWQRFANEKKGLCIMLALPKNGSDNPSRDGDSVGALLRGLLDGPFLASREE